MPTFIALLRGVNVGAAKRVPMADLRGLLSGLGYTGVATEEHARFLVAFVQGKNALSSLAAIESLVVAPEKFAVGRNGAYLLCPTEYWKAKRARLSSARRASLPRRETGQRS